MIYVLIFLFVVWVAPMLVSDSIAKGRNRARSKAFVVTLFFGWFGTLGLWLALKTRDENGNIK